jgi:hypothetical protein
MQEDFEKFLELKEEHFLNKVNFSSNKYLKEFQNYFKNNSKSILFWLNKFFDIKKDSFEFEDIKIINLY